MRLSATIDLHLPGETILRSPSLWERARRAFGAKLDLATDRVRVAAESAALVDQVRTALRPLGITNAVALVIDDQVVFSDTEGRPDDIGDLMIALAEHQSVFGGTFKTMRFALEHEEAGLHYLIETQVRAEHAKNEPAARVRIGARVVELEPRRGETAEAYRARVTPLATDPALLEGHRRQFEATVARLADALRAALPEARVDERAPEARVVKPAERPAKPPPPEHPAYDPYAYYYPSPFEGMLSSMLIASFLTSAFHPPHILVVHPSGAPIGTAEDIAAHPAALDDATDPGNLHEASMADGEGADGGDYNDEGYDDAGYDGGDGWDDGGFDDGFGDAGGFDDFGGID